jgi:formylmethanofuran dehydrogenase subunit E
MGDVGADNLSNGYRLVRRGMAALIETTEEDDTVTIEELRRSAFAAASLRPMRACEGCGEFTAEHTTDASRLCDHCPRGGTTMDQTENP